MSRSKNFAVYENLDTAFVNLGALLRYLQERNFSGRVSVDLGDYRAEIRLRAGERPLCTELDTMTGREGLGEAAMQRLLVRAMDAGGKISVYSDERIQPEPTAAIEDEPPASPEQKTETASEAVVEEDVGRELTDGDRDWKGLLRTSADLIAAVERAALTTGANFSALLHTTRMELADDYSFLDPNAGVFEYARNEIELRSTPNPRAFVSGLSDVLRRVVDKLAVAGRAASVRERVALELAVLARRRGPQLEHFGFMPQLNRIAGTRVI